MNEPLATVRGGDPALTGDAVSAKAVAATTAAANEATTDLRGLEIWSSYPPELNP